MGWLSRAGRAVWPEVRHHWWPFLLFCAGVLIAIALAVIVGRLLQRDAADQVRYFGTWLQLFGILLVAVGLHELRRESKRPGLFASIGQSIARIVQRLGPTRMHAGSGSIGIALGSASLGAYGRVGGTPEKRLDGIEREIDALRKDVDERERALKDELAEVRAELATETSARIDDHATITRKLDNVAVGGLHLEVVGLWWLLIATVATSVPDGVVWLARIAKNLVL